MKEPINIIGAGPANLTAAIVLARHGLKTQVYEMASEVGHRLNGDFQGLENWSSVKDVTELLKGLGIETNFLCAPYYGGTIYDPDGKAAAITSGRPIFYLVKRGSMAGSLDENIRKRGIPVFGEEIRERRSLRFPEKAL